MHQYQRNMAFQSNIVWMAKRVRMQLSPHEDLDKVCYMWLLNAKAFLCQELFSRLKLCIF